MATTFFQSGTGKQFTQEQIMSGSFGADTFFIESGTGRKVSPSDFATPIPTPTPTPATTQPITSTFAFKTQAQKDAEILAQKRLFDVNRFTTLGKTAVGSGAGSIEIEAFKSTVPKDLQSDVFGNLNIKTQITAPKVAATLPSTIETPTTSTLETPTLAEPQVGGIQESFNRSIQSTVDSSRSTLETALTKRIADLDKQRDEAQANIEELSTLEAEGITDVGTLLQPFRETLERTERERLSVNRNFEENQRLVEELGSLLEQGNELIRQQKEITGLSAIRNPRIDKTISDVNARAGVIKAVLNARNGQINQAFTMIDRTVDAVNADKQDQLTYYSSLLDFYSNQKDTEGKKLITLTKDKKDFLNAQIGLLENDLIRSQDNADYIKELMRDPDTASMMAKAGVSLNDTPEQINAKIATQTEFEGAGVTKFTNNQQQKLEQAGLSNASRQTQLDFLFGGKETKATATVENAFDLGLDVGEGDIVTRNGSQFRVSPTGDLVPVTDIATASLSELKTAVKNTFNQELANEVINELNNEQLREFMRDFEDVQNELNTTVDPDEFFIQWKDLLGIKKTTTSTTREI